MWTWTRWIVVNFAKDYKKDSYNKSHLMGKQLRG